MPRRRLLSRILYVWIICLSATTFVTMIRSGWLLTQEKVMVMGPMEPQVMIIDKSSILPPFFRFREEYLVVKKYRLATCQIEKVMTTIRDGIFCYLTDSKNFTSHNRTMSKEYWRNRFCSDLRHWRNDLDRIYEELGPNPILFTIVRDPVERFISGYVDKCLKEHSRRNNTCYKCRRDLRCFVNRLHASLQNVLNHSKENFYYDRHFAPQTWYCDFRDHLRNYTIIKYASGKEGYLKMATDFDMLFERAGVPLHEREAVRSELLKGSTHHTTRGSQAALYVRDLLLSNEDVLAKVIEIYYHDFVEFDFPFPALSHE
ncbi:hypothetical protein Y032_0060g3153 [Ancylostoma ceylanicum]|nr:hypothetical protein Y032_0060g3153 [Ancylostoma ceylanicum]